MKRYISLFLALALVICALPMAVFAAEATTISFETTFEETMTVGDTFTVTANLSNNPVFGTMTLSLKWNEDVVRFTGFNKNARGSLVSDVLIYGTVVADDTTGVATCADTIGYDTNGVIFTANFEIIGSGDLGLGLKDADATEFEMAALDLTDIPVTIDYSALEGLSVAGGDEGAAIPDGAPFTAITTDGGAAIAIEQQEDVNGAPYYIVTIPEDATTAYVTAPDQVVMEDWNTGSMQATAYAFEVENGWNQLYISYNYEESADGPIVEIPMNMVASDWSGEVELCFVEDEDGYLSHAFGIEDASYACLGAISFRYGTASDGGEDEPTTYSITVNQTTGGTVTVYDENMNQITEAAEGDYIFVDCAPDTGYSFKQLYIDGEPVELGMTNGFYTMPAADITVSAVFEAKHTCTYDREVVDEKYLKSEATCQTGAVYYKSCECELFDKSETAATFVSGEKVDHDYVDGVCKWCGEAATEPILSFTAGGQTLEAVTAEDYCSEFEVTAQKLTVTVPAGVNTVTINCAASMCAYIDHVSSDLSPSGKSAEIDLTQDLTFVCVPVTLDDGSDACYHVYFEQEAGGVDPEPEDPAVTPGYTYATSADVSAENGGNATVSVKVTGHSDENVTSYNAYDVTLTFDNTKLEYVGYDGAVKADNGSVTVDGNTIRIVGCGEAKEFGTDLATLTFKTLGEGTADVTVTKAQVSDKEEAVKEDAPEATAQHADGDTAADTTPSQTVILVPYSVTKPGFVSGNDKILHGEDYTFSYTDTTNYTYSDLTVTVGGAPVTPTEANGVYTIGNVTGAIVITATQTPNSYDVNKPENVTGPDKATYGEDYIFTVTPSEEDMAIDTVKVTDAEGKEIPYTINDNGGYVIEGTDITGEFTITVTEKEKMTTVTFSGIEETEIEGGLTQSAEIGKDFTFKLIKEEGYDYTVKVGETELTESKETEGQYTIPAELVVKGGVAVTIEKVDNTTPVVDVVEYISLDGKAMFLVTAKWGDKVLSYGEDTMFWSDKYTVTDEEEAGAYCWLVLSTDEMNTIDLVKAAAEAAIVEAAEGATATEVKYNYDVNGTTKVDVNDAQLAYDMYNASYMEFNDTLPMLKFLEADMVIDGKLDTKDVAAIISYIVSGANA